MHLKRLRFTVKRQRLDHLLVERGLVESRSQAQALIMAGQVISGPHKLDKPGQQVAADTELTLKSQPYPWVSRGGLKLVHAVERFGIGVTDAICCDVGASTGGFTDVLLSRGAATVYAVDVGQGQLAWKLRNDERVVVLEKTNARYLSAADIPDPLDAVVCDASFIGLATVLPAGLTLVRPGGFCVALIKPQFEVGKERVGKKGVVRDPECHKDVCNKITQWFAGLDGWDVAGLTESPITGPEGNKEFLIYAKRNG